MPAAQNGNGHVANETLPGTAPSVHAALPRSLTQWVARAKSIGLDQEEITALFDAVAQAALAERAA